MWEGALGRWVFYWSILMKLEILDRFSKSTQVSDFKKILPMGVELFHADGQTDIKQLIVAFRYLANAPKNST